MSENLKKVLPGLLILLVLLAAVDILGKNFRIAFVATTWFLVFKNLSVAALVLVHAVLALGFWRGTFFLSLSFIVGLMAEVLGTNFGLFFGGYYSFHLVPWVVLWSVPLQVPLFWAVFIYTGYSLSNSFVAWVGGKKPSSKAGHTGLLFLLVFLDGIAVTAIDLFMDPIRVATGKWSWTEGGIYFHVPIGNFAGWFLVTVTVSAIFRFGEFLFPGREDRSGRRLLLVPSILYLLFFAEFFNDSLNLRLYAVTMVGIFAMMPFVVINWLLYFYHRDINSSPEVYR